MIRLLLCLLDFATLTLNEIFFFANLTFSLSFAKVSLTFIIFVTLSLVSALNNQMMRGDVTFYYEWKGNFGSCALNESRKDPFYVAALSKHFMKLPARSTNPNKHPFCDEKYCIKVNGKRGSVVLKVSDTCSGCKPHDVDVADRIFPLLDDPKRGRVAMTWQWVDCRKNPPGKRKN